MKNIICIGLMVVLFMACTKEEELIPGKFITDQVGQVNMVSNNGVEYQKQLYFDLSSGQLKAENSRDAWDFGFSCNKDNPLILVNAAMLQSVAKTGETDFGKTYAAANYNFEFERAESYYASSWMKSDFDASNEPKGEVFLVDLGRDLQNQKRGRVKVQITNFENGAYTLQVANLNGSNPQALVIRTNADYNFQFVSLKKPTELLSLEPSKEEWDFHFTKYMERLWDGEDTVDYSVTGVLLNPNKCAAYNASALLRDTINTLSYGNVKLSNINETSFSSSAIAVGHQWKYFDLDAGAFQLLTPQLYFIKDVHQQVYKFRFVGFYDAAGNKGAVSFEYLPL